MIREANINDYVKIEDLVEQIHERHLTRRPDIFNDQKAISYDDFKASLDNRDTLNFVYEEDGIIKGYVMATIKIVGLLPFMKERKIIFVEDIVVDKQYKNKGIGTKLFNKIQEIGIKLNIREIELNVWALNDEAIDFYRKMGFQMQRIQMEKQI